MKFCDYLREDQTNIDMKARTKDEAINELAELLREAEEVKDFDAFVRDVFERESQASTGIGNGAAAPHARTDAVNSFVIALGKSEEGIDFDSIDGKPVNVFFLMGTPKNPLGNYLKMLAHLTRLLRDPGFVDSLVKARSASEVISYFRDAEE